MERISANKRTFSRHLLGVTKDLPSWSCWWASGCYNDSRIFRSARHTQSFKRRVSFFICLAKIATSAPFEHDDTRSESKAKPFTFLQAALFQWVNPKAWAVALTAISAYTPSFHSMINVAMVAVIFGAVTLPSTSAWVLIGAQLRRFLTDPFRLQVFNVCAALLLIASLYPILFAKI